MKRDAFIDYLEQALHQAAAGPPTNPRPEGQFVGTAKGLVSGIRMVTPRGKIFYLAVLELRDMAESPPGDDDGPAEADQPTDDPQ